MSQGRCKHGFSYLQVKQCNNNNILPKQMLQKQQEYAPRCLKPGDPKLTTTSGSSNSVDMTNGHHILLSFRCIIS